MSTSLHSFLTARLPMRYLLTEGIFLTFIELSKMYLYR